MSATIMFLKTSELIVRQSYKKAVFLPQKKEKRKNAMERAVKNPSLNSLRIHNIIGKTRTLGILRLFAHFHAIFVDKTLFSRITPLYKTLSGYN